MIGLPHEMSSATECGVDDATCEHVPTVHHHSAVALACDLAPYFFAVWRDHELIFSRVVGMAFEKRVWRMGFGEVVGNRGRTRERLTPGPLQTRRVARGAEGQTSLLSQTMRRRPMWIITSDQCQKKAPYRKLSTTPNIPHRTWVGKLGRPFTRALIHALASWIASSLCQIVKTNSVVVAQM